MSHIATKDGFAASPSEYACAKCGDDPTKYEGWSELIRNTLSDFGGEKSPDGKRYCFACWGCWRDDHWSKREYNFPVLVGPFHSTKPHTNLDDHAFALDVKAGIPCETKAVCGDCGEADCTKFGPHKRGGFEFL